MRAIKEHLSGEYTCRKRTCTLVNGRGPIGDHGPCRRHRPETCSQLILERQLVLREGWKRGKGTGEGGVAIAAKEL